jgi:putative ABC transport system permease protein
VRRSQEDFAAEIRSHLELEAAQLAREGVSEADAKLEARKKFGNVGTAQERFYRSMHVMLLDDLWRDVRHSTRVLARTPGFAVVAIVLLALGIGATTTLFSAVNGVLLRPLPYQRPEQLVAVGLANPRQPHLRGGASAPDFLDWRERARAFSDLAAYRPWGFVIDGNGEPERVLGVKASANLFRLLGVRPLLGRTFLTSEGQFGSSGVVLLSERLWRRRFGGDSSIIGTGIDLDGERHIVIGIIQSGLGPSDAELWTPLAFAPYELTQRGNRSLSVVGRLQPGMQLSVAQAEMQSIAESLAKTYPAADAGWSARVAPLKDEIVGDTKTSLVLLFSATCAVLLVACTNLANLILAREQVRQRELTIRSALGAGTHRLIRQLGTEYMLVLLIGWLGALLLSFVATQFFERLGPEYLPRSGEVAIDSAVLWFAIVAMFVVGIGLALLLVRQLAEIDLTTSIKGGSGTLGNPGGLLRDSLLVAQVAISFLLLLGGTLLIMSFLRAGETVLGFDPANVLSVTVSLPTDRYPAPDQRLEFFRELTDRVQVRNGVTSVGLVSSLPLSRSAGGAGPLAELKVEGDGLQSAAQVPRANLVAATSDYFHSLRIRLLRGRLFSPDDKMQRRPVAIIDEGLAERIWPRSMSTPPRIRIGTSLGADTAWREVVGVVNGVKATSVERDPEPTVYLPYAQTAWPTMALVARTVSDPASYAAAVRRDVLDLDPSEPVYNVRSLEQVVDRALAARRFQTLLFTGFALIALLLAVVGVYGLLSFSIAQRTRELAIRVALGAQARHVKRIVIRQAAVRVGLGLTMGLMLTPVTSNFVRSFLFEVNPWDLHAMTIAVFLLVSAGLLASYVPARRAAMADPLIALKRE